mgnify:CR=1 FL=1
MTKNRKLALRKRRLRSLTNAETKAKNTDFKKLWNDKKRQLLRKPL